jgi:hypothetical protein
MKFHIRIIVMLWGLLSSLLSQGQRGQVYLGVSKKTESFNIENIRNSSGSSLDNIQYDANKFFGSWNLYGTYRVSMKRQFFLSAVALFRHNHHYYTKLKKVNTVVQNLPVKRKLKMDFSISLGKKVPVSKQTNLLFSVGVGCNNINSGYDYTYNDTTNLGQPFVKNFKGNWVKFTPKCAIGLERKKILFQLDTEFTKDPTFNNLTSIIVGATLAYRLF